MNITHVKSQMQFHIEKLKGSNKLQWLLELAVNDPKD